VTEWITALNSQRPRSLPLATLQTPYTPHSSSNTANLQTSHELLQVEAKANTHLPLNLNPFSGSIPRTFSIQLLLPPVIITGDYDLPIFITWYLLIDTLTYAQITPLPPSPYPSRFSALNPLSLQRFKPFAASYVFSGTLSARQTIAIKNGKVFVAFYLLLATWFLFSAAFEGGGTGQLPLLFEGSSFWRVWFGGSEWCRPEEGYTALDMGMYLLPCIYCPVRWPSPFRRESRWWGVHLHC